MVCEICGVSLTHRRKFVAAVTRGRPLLALIWRVAPTSAGTCGGRTVKV